MAKILVVDDEKDVIDLVSFVLEKDGHQVLGASNGTEGYEATLSEKPDLLILDVMMPEMDGYTLTTRLQGNVLTKSIPIIIVTAKGKTREAFELQENVKGYVEKPFDPKDLRDLVYSKIPKP